MRWWTVLALLSCVSPAAQAAPPDPLAQAVTWLGHADGAVRQRAFDVLVERADAARLVDPTSPAPTPLVREALHGARYLVGLAERLKAAPAGRTARYVVLEEALRSSWSAHVEALLARAGLGPADARRLLAERAAARVAYDAYFEAAWESMMDPRAAVAAAVKVGPALVPHLVAPLAVAPWLTLEAWPQGEIAIRQRMSCWALQALRSPEAVPYLLAHVDAPSATLQFDVLTALAAITGDATWKVDVGATDRLRALRTSWWARAGKPHASAARSWGLDALREATAYLVTVTSDPGQRRSVGADGGPDPLRDLCDRLRGLGVSALPDLPPPAESLAARDVGAWLERIASAIHALEDAP